MKNQTSATTSLPIQLGAVCASIALASAAAFASTTGTSSAPSTPPTNAYIEPPQQSTVTVTRSDFGGSSYYQNYSPGWNGWSGSHYSSMSVEVSAPRRYFFPPIPPALGEPYLRNRTKSASLSRSTIPLALSEYVNEPFYSPISPFLFEEDLPKRRQKEIDDYMAEKRGLISELQGVLASVEKSDAATREARLAEFALQQTPRVAAVEARGYGIRDELTHWHWFSASADWNEARDWRLGDNAKWESTLDEAKAMRGSAYYDDGLLPAQRRLLRELAMELDDSGAGPTADVRLDARGPYLYFSPETSRIRLPAHLPTELAAKIATYTQQKSELKKELREVLYHEDRRWFASTRTAALRALAEKQAARLAALEPLAEEIRRGLAVLPNPARPPQPAELMPTELANRITAFMDKKTAYEQTMNTRLVELKKRFATSRVEFVKQDGAFGIQIVPNRRLSAEARAEVADAQRELVGFNEQASGTFNTLLEEKQAIREQFIKSTGTLSPLVTSRIVDLILREYSATLGVQELWRQYHDYDVAVLQPGLSPEQRRMLYDAALVKLDQQIPHFTY